MRVLQQKKEIGFTAEELHEYASHYSTVCVDIGTGDGKRLYRTAKAHPDTLFIGIDPVRENMLDTAQKISKKPEKGGLRNLLLVIGAVESLPEELYGIANEITVYFPWGSLLESVVKPLPDSLAQMRQIAAESAQFTFITTYQTAYEAAEIEKRGLPELSRAYFEGEYQTVMRENGFAVSEITELTAEDVMQLGTQWAKRLVTGRARSYYQITGTVAK